MSADERLMEVDPRIPRIVQRSNRRRYTFGRGSSHEWRRDERAAYDGKPPKNDDRTHRGHWKVSEVDMSTENVDGKISPDDLGTNAILREFGFDYRQRDEIFAVYDKQVVKQASRIAAAYAGKYGVVGIKGEVSDLLEAVHLLGAESVAYTVLNDGMKPSELMRSGMINGLLEYKTPTTYVRKPLEVIAANTQIETCPRLVIGVPYQPAHYLGTKQRR